MIDLIHTGQKKLHYVGYSQGTTVFFVMGSLHPEYNDKILSMNAFGPAACMAHNKNALFNALSPIIHRIKGEIISNNAITAWVGETFCKDVEATQVMCSNLMFRIVGRNEEQLNAMLPVIIGHFPAGASTRQIVHFVQSIADKEFRCYDLGWLKNFLIYGTRTPLSYNLGNMKIPTFLHYTYNDPLSQIEDVDRLYKELGASIKMLVPLPLFNHMDFLLAILSIEEQS